MNVAKKQIKKLEREKAIASVAVGWKLDRKKYRAVLFYADGKPGMPINLRPLFEQYPEESNR